MHNGGAAISGQTPAVDTAGQKVIPLWAIWLGLCALLILNGLPFILEYQAQEPDDWMRLLQVRDLVDGQAWFDTRQYRIDPPFGAEMHWVRLVDLPIAAALALFKPFFTQRVAETLAMTVVPLGQLLVAMLLLRDLLRRLGLDPVTTLIAITIIPLFPLLEGNFIPMRIDHHAWQAIATLAVLNLLVRGGYRASFAAGVIGAASVFISVEAIPILAALGGLFASRYWLEGKRDHEGYLMGLALGGLGLYPLLRPLGEFGRAYCDMMSWPHFLAFGLAALAALASRVMPGQASRTGRLIALAALPLVAGPALLVPLGICAISPMSSVDPFLLKYWFSYLIESQPFYRQWPSAMGMTLWNVGIIAVGARLALKQAATDQQRADWWLVILASAAAGVVSLLILRGGITAQLLALPFAALILSAILPRARAVPGMGKRILATFACFLIATPTLASAVLKLANPKIAYTFVRHPQMGEDGDCKVDDLLALPPGQIFATLDKGPEIVARTSNTVVSAGYHRNQKKMLEVFAAFSGPLDQARGIILANHAKYVFACTGSPDLAAYANLGEDNLADRIYANRPPEWLEPLPAVSHEAMRVYRVH